MLVATFCEHFLWHLLSLFPFGILLIYTSIITLLQEELNKHNNGAQASQPVQKTQSHMPQKVDIYSQVKGPEKRGCVHCIGNIPKPKKPKASLSENQELRDELKKMRASLEKMRESQEKTNMFMANMMFVIQNRLWQICLNVLLQAAKQVYYILRFEFIF